MLRFSRGIPFCLKLIFFEENKAEYGLWIGKNDEVSFELSENTIVGIAKYCNDFSLEYKIHPSLKLTSDQEFECKKLIHKAIASMLPKLFLEIGINTLTFTPTFPAYVWEILNEGPLLSQEDVAFNFSRELADKDK